jgi:hypothetical protein
MRSSIDHIHHLNSTTLKPFVESISTVLLYVNTLPISRRSRTFVLEYQKIGKPIRPAVLIRSVLIVLDQVADAMQDSDVTFAQIDFLNYGDILALFNISTISHIMLFQGLDNLTTFRGATKEAE